MYETAVEDGTTEELRRQQVEELRLVRQRMWKVLDNPPPAISRTGKIVVDEQGEPVEDAAAVLGAAAMIVKANERTSKLRGTEAPRRSVTMTGSASVAEIRAAMATWDPASIRAALEEAAAELAEKDAEAARRPHPRHCGGMHARNAERPGRCEGWPGLLLRSRGLASARRVGFGLVPYQRLGGYPRVLRQDRD